MAEAITETELRTLKLCQLFPCLARTTPIRQGLWDPNDLDAWAVKASAGEKHAARFVLTVWNQYEDWQCGKFNVFDAVVSWDDMHREAFLVWVRDPWFA